MKNKFPRIGSWHIVALAALLIGTSMLFSCSKDKDTSKPDSKSHKLVFKAKASSGCILTTATYGYDTQMANKSSLNGTTWTSEEMTAPAGTVVATVGVSAEGVDASSTLTVQIYVDGELKKEGLSTGAVLTAAATYQF